jgi:hypothetical protein
MSGVSQLRGASRQRIAGAAIASIVASILILPAKSAPPLAAPDFSGVWGRTSVDYEPPPSGPGPVMNKTRSFYMRIGDDTNPILKPEAAQKIRDAAAISRTGENFPTPSNQCTPWSAPYAWRALLMQMVQQKDQVVIIYVGDQQLRHIRLNAQHPARVTPSYMGDSIGHYEGDTLVIDTVGLKPGRFSMIDNYGTPFSERLHVVERIRFIPAADANKAAEQAERDSGRVDVDMGGASVDPKAFGLQIQFTVEDPIYFTRAWSGTVTYRRSLGPWEERVCADGRHNYISGEDFALPKADKPDF